MGDARTLREDRIVASSEPDVAPEYRLQAVVRREFHGDMPTVRLVIEGPLERDTEYWDSHHVELVVDLIRRALPALREAEEGLEAEWQEWASDSDVPRPGAGEALRSGR